MSVSSMKQGCKGLQGQYLKGRRKTVGGWRSVGSGQCRTVRLGTLEGREPRGRSSKFESGSPGEGRGRHLKGSLNRAEARERMNHLSWKMGMGVGRKTPGAGLKR